MDGKKIIVITGGSEGLGAAIAIALKSEVHKIWLLARSEVKLNEIKTNLLSEGFACDIITCNLTDEQQVIAAIDHIIYVDEQIDVLINNAGVWTETNIETISFDEIQNTFQVNVFALILLSGRVAPLMKKNGSGTILNIISTSAIDAEGEWPVYVSSKFAVMGFSESLKKKYANTGVKIMDVYPGGINTNFYQNAGIEMAPNQDWMMDKNDVAGVIKNALLSPGALTMDHFTIRKV